MSDHMNGCCAVGQVLGACANKTDVTPMLCYPEDEKLLL